MAEVTPWLVFQNALEIVESDASWSDVDNILVYDSLEAVSEAMGGATLNTSTNPAPRCGGCDQGCTAAAGAVHAPRRRGRGTGSLNGQSRCHADRGCQGGGEWIDPRRSRLGLASATLGGSTVEVCVINASGDCKTSMSATMVWDHPEAFASNPYRREETTISLDITYPIASCGSMQEFEL